MKNSLKGASVPDFNNTEIAFKGRSDADMRRAYWLFKLMSSKAVTDIGKAFTTRFLKWGLPVTPVIKKTVFAQFCGGESIDDCEAALSRLAARNVGAILDYAAEGIQSEQTFANTTSETLAAIRKASTDKRIPLTVFKPTGLIRFGLMQKISEGKSLSVAEEAEFVRAKARVNQVCRTAFELGVPVMIDAEESWIQPAIDELALEMMRSYNREKAIVYNTYQLYRKDKLASLKADIARARAEGFIMAAKLVRGAYMEKERARAARMGYPSPINETKADTDRDYDAAVQLCIDNLDHVALLSGSHNEKSNLLLAALLQQKGIQPDHPHVYFSQLLGMSDNLSFNLAEAGYNVTKYVPYGPVKMVMPYLFRRAEENTSIAGQTSRELNLIETELKRRRKS